MRPPRTSTVIPGRGGAPVPSITVTPSSATASAGGDAAPFPPAQAANAASTAAPMAMRIMVRLVCGLVTAAGLRPASFHVPYGGRLLTKGLTSRVEC
jgi:hypothetical protein